MHTLIKTWFIQLGSFLMPSGTFHVKTVDQPYKWALSVRSAAELTVSSFPRNMNLKQVLGNTLAMPKQCRLEK